MKCVKLEQKIYLGRSIHEFMTYHTANKFYRRTLNYK